MVFKLLYQLKKLSRKAVTELLVRTLQRVRFNASVVMSKVFNNR